MIADRNLMSKRRNMSFGSTDVTCSQTYISMLNIDNTSNCTSYDSYHKPLLTIYKYLLPVGINKYTSRS